MRPSLTAVLLLVLGSPLSAQSPPARVSSASPQWREAAPWTVDARPVVLLGEQDGAEHLLFNRIVGVFRAGEHVVVGDGGSRTVRVLSGDGALVRSFGGEGAGPGEIRDLTRMWVEPDGTPAVYDGRLQRLTLYRSAGRPLIFPVHGTSPFVIPFGRLGNGEFVTGTPTRSSLGGQPGDILADSLVIWVGSQTHRRVERWPNRSRMVVGTAEWIRYPFLPLSVGPSVAVAADGFVTGHGSSPELRYYSADGTLWRTVTWSPARERVTGRIRAEVAEALVAGERSAQREWARFAEEAPYPDLVPVFDRILLDDVGATWVRSYDWRGNLPERWTVIDEHGRWLGDLTLPARFEATEFGRDHIAGITRDDLGVERAAVLRLHRR